MQSFSVRQKWHCPGNPLYRFVRFNVDQLTVQAVFVALRSQMCLESVVFDACFSCLTVDL